ncbi:hypothetical protein ACLOJK_014914 [Asimina triloba]
MGHAITLLVGHRFLLGFGHALPDVDLGLLVRLRCLDLMRLPSMEIAARLAESAVVADDMEDKAVVLSIVSDRRIGAPRNGSPMAAPCLDDGAPYLGAPVVYGARCTCSNAQQDPFVVSSEAPAIANPT